MKTFIIAEAGVNHNGDKAVAKKLVDAAAKAGADAVKFQTFKAAKVVTAGAAKATYQAENIGAAGTQLEMLEKLELSASAHKELAEYCVKKGIMFMSTAFDAESADMLDRLGMKIFKIPSGEITNKPFIEHIALKKKPIILSTGMSYIGEVEKAVGWINEKWKSLKQRPQLTLLHCVSNYPAQPEDSNLLAIQAMERAFGLPVGFSDHTRVIEVAVAAVAVGAKVVEKHFTLDRTMKGPDHRASLEPHELTAMVESIRNVEKSLGDGIKRPVTSEADTRIAARRSLVAARDIKAGKIIAEGDILIKRPGDGILPEFKDIIVGMRARQNINADSVIRWEHLKDA